MRNHHAAHHEAGLVDAPPIMDHPLVPTGEPELLTEQAPLGALVDELRTAGSFGYDTEFIGEQTFYPQICVIQVSTPDRLVLIDALADLDLTPFWELLADPGVEKIVHAGRQDFEPVMRFLDRPPRHVFDTQIVGGFVEPENYPLALGKLVLAFTGGDVGPGLKFSQWDHRPLSDEQRFYAANDVRYLHLLKDELLKKLDQTGHRAWALEELETQEDPTLYRFDPLTQKLKAKGVATLSRRNQAVLRSLLLWRGRTAQAENVPTRMLVPDAVLVDLAMAKPTDAAGLSQARGLPRPVREHFADTLLAAIAEGATGPAAPKKKIAPRLTAGQERRVETLWAAVRQACEDRSIAPGAVLAKRQLIAWVRDTPPPPENTAADASGSLFSNPDEDALSDTTGTGPDSPLLRGWRGQFLGDLLRSG